ncbi:MAG: ATP-binding cassette domain-containing protein [Eubacteriales bacterium]
MSVIEVKGLSKTIGDHQVLCSACLTIDKGELCAIIGANGAGKTSLLKCITGLMFPDEGIILYDDTSFVDNKERVLSQIGVVMQYPNSISSMNVEELFVEHYQYLKIEKPDSINLFLNKVNLNVSLKQKIGGMSVGMKQRLLIALALSHKPQILLLDEPFNGLDPDGIMLIKEILQEFTDIGGTVLISSHSLSELEQFADSVVLIKNGKTTSKMNLKDVELNYKDGLRGYYKELMEGNKYHD